MRDVANQYYENSEMAVCDSMEQSLIQCAKGIADMLCSAYQYHENIKLEMKRLECNLKRYSVQMNNAIRRYEADTAKVMPVIRTLSNILENIYSQILKTECNSRRKRELLKEADKVLRQLGKFAGIVLQ